MLMQLAVFTLTQLSSKRAYKYRSFIRDGSALATGRIHSHIKIVISCRCHFVDDDVMQPDRNMSQSISLRPSCTAVSDWAVQHLTSRIDRASIISFHFYSCISKMATCSDLPKVGEEVALPALLKSLTVIQYHIAPCGTIHILLETKL